FFSSRRRHTRFSRDWSSDVCSSDLGPLIQETNGSSQSSLDQVTVPYGPYEIEAETPVAFSAARSSGSPAAFESAGPISSLLSARSEERRVGKECRSRWWPSAENDTN